MIPRAAAERNGGDLAAYTRTVNVRSFIPATALLAIAGVVLATSPDSPAFDPSAPGKAAPKFKLDGVDGKSFTNASLKGKVVLVDLWATWCGPCKQAAPTIDKLHAKYAKRGVVVIGASTDDTKAEVLAYRKKHGYKYAFATNGQALADGLQAPGIPFFVVIGKDGKIIAEEVGFSGETEGIVASASDKGLKK